MSAIIWAAIRAYWKPLAVTAVLLAVAAGVGWYGHIQYQKGFTVRDTQAKLELAAQRDAAYQEKTRLEHERDAADQKYQALKSDTAARAADLDVQLDRLRKQLSTAQRQHVDSGATGGTYDTDTDWIGIIGTCWGDYAELGKEAAKYADRVNGLQGYVRAVQAK